MKKSVRSISGITPVAVMLKPYKCPGNCIYCPSDPTVPKSYTKTSPVVLRAIDCEYDAKKQTEARLRVLKRMGHVTDKVELIIMGGTFSAYPLNYQQGFIKGCFDGMNGCVSQDLEKAKKLNEIADHRCVGMCLETRPDYCKKEHINNFLDYGATRVEIGVQTLDDKIHQITKRGHDVKEIIEATSLLKDSGYKVFYHMMLGLPGSDPEKDLETFKTLFSDQKFRPDGLKIYPTFVVKGTELERLYYNGDYKPYTTEEIVELIVKIKQIIPRYVRIMRVMRDLPAEHIVSDCIYSHLRDEIERKLKEKGLRCNCIRCREVSLTQKKKGILPENIELCRMDYDASNGKEIFLSFEDVEKNILVSILRLRIPSKPFRKEITPDSALLREIHTYSWQLPVGAKPRENDFQHRGYGKKLITEAERIAKEEFRCNKMVVISGVGVRRYFTSQGYFYDGPYVSKKL